MLFLLGSKMGGDSAGTGLWILGTWMLVRQDPRPGLTQRLLLQDKKHAALWELWLQEAMELPFLLARRCPQGIFNPLG